MSSFIDSWTSARLAAWAQEWQPTSTAGVVGRAVADGMVGLVGIVAPYMPPSRCCSSLENPASCIASPSSSIAVSTASACTAASPSPSCRARLQRARQSRRRQRQERAANASFSAILITFVPCSARSAIILAIGGKYQAGPAFAIFALTLFVIALLGRLLVRRHSESAPGLVQIIPPTSCPPGRASGQDLGAHRDIVTIVTPLLVIGSVVLALLSHFGADAVINTALIPVTTWWLGCRSCLACLSCSACCARNCRC